MRIIKISSLMQGALETQRPHRDERCIEYYMTHFEGTEPVLVYEDAGELILVDGHHRVEAARRLDDVDKSKLESGDASGRVALSRTTQPDLVVNNS
jgi:uncharacterized protein (DUF1015 family)